LLIQHREITLTISSATDFGLYAAESREEYVSRLKIAIRNLDEGKGIIYAEGELDEFAMECLKR
jgi:hypothetical protein